MKILIQYFPVMKTLRKNVCYSTFLHTHRGSFVDKPRIKIFHIFFIIRVKKNKAYKFHMSLLYHRQDSVLHTETSEQTSSLGFYIVLLDGRATGRQSGNNSFRHWWRVYVFQENSTDVSAKHVFTSSGSQSPKKRVHGSWKVREQAPSKRR